MFLIPDVVLFDLRGTLVDPARAWRLTDALRLRFLRKCGACASEAELRRQLERAVAEVNALTFRQREYFDQDRLVLQRAAELAGLRSSKAELDAFARWRDRAFARALQAFPDAQPTLLGLRRRGIRVGCVADGGRDYTHRVLERLELLDLLDVVVASEESREVKATGAALRLACSRLGVEPAEALYVGDRLDKDVQMARAAGAPAFLLDRTGARRERGVETISSLFELLEFAEEEASWSRVATT